ncbi:MAG: hypothetical protein IJX99_04965 [Clostridia bacterium]|nr:hypothetical protein [Clostridia bacterium]
MALFVPVFILTLLGTLSEVFAILALVCFIILPPLSYGATSVFIRKRNGEDVQPFDLFNDGFSNFGRAWKVSLRLFLKYLVPVVILAFALIAPLVVEMSTTMAAPSIDMSLMPSYSGATVMNTMVSSIVSMIALVAYVISFIILFIKRDSPF